MEQDHAGRIISPVVMDAPYQHTQEMEHPHHCAPREIVLFVHAFICYDS